MKINTIRQNKEEKKVNQNLMWISAEIPPLKPDNASRYMRYKHILLSWITNIMMDVWTKCLISVTMILKKRNGNWISRIKLDSISHFQVSTK